MKLIRFGAEGLEKPGVQLPCGSSIDVSAAGLGDYNETFFAQDGLSKLADWLDAHAPSAPRIAEDVRRGSCVARPSKIVCIGLNYAKHAAETGATPPTEPVLFFKSTTALTGPNDGLIIPKGSVKTDWEVELAIVIGKKASYVPLEHAYDYIAGYALHNDYSEREWQIERCGQWAKGKGADTFAPLGPVLVTKDEIPNEGNLRLWLKVNGQMMQDGNTNDFIFNVPHVVSYLSQFMTLLPGDVISTGTPAGVGLGLKPPTFLKPGDIIELGIDGLGEQRQVARAYGT
ncbi:MAG: fumarylacetoacetate hydrolase family protein [Verrucomicrobiota bacterium]